VFRFNTIIQGIIVTCNADWEITEHTLGVTIKGDKMEAGIDMIL
jgi:hypothetical protein